MTIGSSASTNAAFFISPEFGEELTVGEISRGELYSEGESFNWVNGLVIASI